MIHLLEIVIMPDDLTWLEPQELWLRRRSMCAFNERHAECVEQAYEERIGILHAMLEGPALETRPAECLNTQVLQAARFENFILLYDDEDVLVTIATLQRDQDSIWESYAVGNEIDGGLSLAFADGRSLNCTVMASA
ncbi:hypothetical protein [Erythrobacter dokdonensis]|uniref:hypothetical protein n=1 Tax=Erythrobacter dokdonensis TaxID=328225 RepID=UPI0012EE2721|nr:hypothetical protein [Erythrobacter dokdonensis]